MIGVYNHILSKVFSFHYHSQKVIGSLGCNNTFEQRSKPLQNYIGHYSLLVHMGQLITAHGGGIDWDVPPIHSLSHHTRSLRLSAICLRLRIGETIGGSLQTMKLSPIGRYPVSPSQRIMVSSEKSHPKSYTPLRKLTCQWKIMEHLLFESMNFLLKIRIFQPVIPFSVSE